MINLITKKRQEKKMEKKITKIGVLLIISLVFIVSLFSHPVTHSVFGAIFATAERDKTDTATRRQGEKGITYNKTGTPQAYPVTEAENRRFHKELARQPVGTVRRVSPYAMVTNLGSGNFMAEFSGLPATLIDGREIEPGWIGSKGYFTAGLNLFSASVEGIQITIEALNDQPTGARKGDDVTWFPQVFLNGTEISAISEIPTLLEIDPVNENYQNNTLEWDYGVAKRRLRIIEGMIRGSWVFPADPKGEVRIKYNQTGELSLQLGYAHDADGHSLEVIVIDNDEEIISASEFDKAVYPVKVGDSSTFYPDANPETSSVDGEVRRGGIGGQSWADLRSGAGTASFDDWTEGAFVGFQEAGGYLWEKITRGIFLFDTSSLGSGAVISAATLSLRGYNKSAGTFYWVKYINVYSSAPASNTALASGDYSSLGTTHFCNSGISYDGWSTTAYNDFALNTSGMNAISKTGVSKFGVRDINYDAGGSEPEWVAVSGISWSVGGYWAEQGTGYKPKLVVTYTVPVAPTVTTQSASSIGTTDATLNGNITDIGGENCTERGFEWDIDSGETYANTWTETGDYGTGTFNHIISSLSPGVTYYFRAKALNSAGWAYGSELSFTTISTITVTGTSIAPAGVSPGDTEVGMLKLGLVTDGGSAQWTDVKVDLTGTAVDSDISSVEVWKDDGSHTWDPSLDTEIGSGTFSIKTVAIDITDQTINTSSQDFFIVYDIAVGADPSHEAGAKLLDNTYITVSGSNEVSSNGFPIESGSTTLPVVLSTFTAQFLYGVATLYWRTESETDNIGWYVYRNTADDFEAATRVTNELIPGYGTTPEQHDYIYHDEELEIISGSRYWYWLESIDYSGCVYHYNRIINITIPDGSENPNQLEPPISYNLQGSPNPSKGSTKISFTLSKTALIEIKIYNIRGELVKDLYNGTAYGDVEVKRNWDGRDENGIEQPTGIYLYGLKVNGKVNDINRLILIR